MFRFGCEQKIFTIGNVKVGGRPGELPTVLIGSMFHRGHKIVEDHRRGIFDERGAEKLIMAQQEMSDKPGNPCMVDVVADSGEALKNYIDFVSCCTDVPMLINGTSASVRLQGLKRAYEVGLKNRSIYTSINYTLTGSELEGLRELKAESAVIQAFNPRDPLRPEGMYYMLQGSTEKEGLLKSAERVGIAKLLILASVLDIPSIGIACKAINLIKDRLGMPSGAAPLGVFSGWGGRVLGDDAKTLGRAAAAAIIQASGGNFIIYGSIAKAKTIFPPCAAADIIIAYAAKASGIAPLDKNHPLYKIKSGGRGPMMR